jgi:O-acetyl-ADP-ribose deacetylase (regulator of RNase III)
MIKKKGDLFTSTAQAIGHGVNCHGVMGSGIAVAFKEKFPRNYVSYRNACQTKMLQPGETIVFNEGGLFIFNIASQAQPGANATYPFLFSAAYDAAQQAVALGINRLAIPLIGCGIGGLEWKHAEKILLAVEGIFVDFEFEVWKL